MQEARLRIGGVAREGLAVEQILNPFNDEVVGEVSVGGPDDMDDAIAAAAAGFEEARNMPAHRRIKILEGIAAGLRGRAGDLANLMAREGGKPIRFCRGEVARAIVTFELGAAAARAEQGGLVPLDIDPRGEGRLCMQTRVPRGPVAAISPFNFPLNLIAHKLSPAIAVGTTSVLKPPPQCPLTGFTLAEIAQEAGLPGSMLHVVHCPPQVAQRMVEDPRMRVLSFTGSDKVGWALKRLAGQKQVMLELGGNAPCIVDEDVDFEAVMEPLLLGAWAHAGQVCIKVQRILVPRTRIGEFVGRFVEATEGVACGDPLDESTVVGPLIDKPQVTRVLSWIDEAVASGAHLRCGGVADGNVVAPTVLTNVDPQARVHRDEVFGPVTVVEAYDDFDEALQMCNASRYGLQVGVFTRDLGKAMRAFETLDYGGVLINQIPTFRVDNMPYGGTKDSGFGREGVRYACEEFTEPKMLVMSPMPAS